MNEDAFLELCTEKGYNKEVIEKFEEALQLAHEHLSNKKRLSGDTFFDHNVRVGKILVDIRAPPEVVEAGLLHDVQDHMAPEKIRETFGAEVLTLIRGEKSIDAIKAKNTKAEAETLRKIMLTTVKDIRIIVLKLANKLDNLRTIKALSLEEQKRIAQEVLDIYAPLAYRLGIEKIKTDMENLSLEILEPQKYQEIAQFLEKQGTQREKEVEGAILKIKDIARSNVKIIQIKGRFKHIYSIYKKLKLKNLTLDEIYDLVGIRVLVPEVKDCYMLLGMLHEFFEPVEGKLKDYIANPKPNLYRSIHTTVKMPNGKRVEVQIRTPEMDEFAEEGVAAHWKYKKISSEESFEKKVSWLRGILDWQQDGVAADLLETAKVDVFGEEIYCYTPKGDAKELPLGATVLDFAYVVHEEVGSKAIGGRVNGKFVSLKHELSSGDVVEIITNKNQRPRRSWLKFVKSARAKQKIRKELKEHDHLPTLIYRNLRPVEKEGQGILLGAQDYPTAVCSLAKCCQALPGEKIVGIVTKRRMISVHKKECRLALPEEERWVKVNWKDSFNQKIKFYVQAVERRGLLADLLHTIASAGFEVKEAKAKLLDNDKAECSFLVVPRDLETVIEMIVRVKKLKGVVRVYFE